jgi:hypothetical protein
MYFDEAILEETKRLDMENGPTNLAELLDMMFSDHTFHASEVSNSITTTNPLLGLVNSVGGVVGGVVGGLTGVVGGVLGGVTGAVGNILTGGNNISNANGTVSTNTTSGDPLSTVVGGLGNAIGTGIQSNGTVNGGLGDLVTGVVGGLLNTTSTVVGSLGNSTLDVVGGLLNGTTGVVGGLLDGTTTVVGDLLNGTTGVVGGLLDGTTGVVGDLLNGTTGVVGGLLNGTTTVVGDLLNGTTGVVGGLLDGTTGVVGDLLNGTTGVVGGLLNGTTTVVGDLLNGTTTVVGGVLNTTSGIVSGLTNGTLTVPSLIDQIVDVITNMSDSGNPIGKFILNVIAYLSSNQESAIVNFIKFSSFIYVVVKTFVQLATVADNISENIKKSIVEAIIGAIGRLVLTGASGTGFRRFQNMTIDELPNCQDALFQIIHDQIPAGTLYALQLDDVAHDVISNVCAIDPYFLLSVIPNPSKISIRTAVNLIADLNNA